MSNGRLVAALLALTSLAGCLRDETLYAYGAKSATWQLYEINGKHYEAAPITIEFLEGGAVRGTMPCNSYTARQTRPYPWFGLKDIVVTERACPQLFAETIYLDLLKKMTLSEVKAPYLVLSQDEATYLAFKAAPHGA